MHESRGIQWMEIDDRKTNRSIDKISSLVSISIGQSMSTQKSFIDWHRLDQDLETDVTHTIY